MTPLSFFNPNINIYTRDSKLIEDYYRSCIQYGACKIGHFSIDRLLTPKQQLCNHSSATITKLDKPVKPDKLWISPLDQAMFGGLLASGSRTE